MISAIIPFYNSEKYISEAIVSILNQTYTDFEIICVDNNSSDASLTIVNSFIEKYPSKIKLIDEKRKGANFARNTGLIAAKGSYIQFLDADDIISKNKFELQLKGFDSEKMDIVVSDRVVLNEDLSVVKSELTFSKIIKTPLNTVVSDVIITGNPLYKKTFLLEIGAWDEQLLNAQDWELNIRAVLRGAKIGYVPGAFLHCRTVSDSLSSNWKNVSITSASIIVKYYDQLISFPEKLDKVTWHKVFFLFYLSAVFSDKHKRSELIFFIINKIPDWQSYIVNPVKKIVLKLLGLKALVYFERIVSR